MDPAPSPTHRCRTRRILPAAVAVVLVIDVAGAVGTAIYQTGAQSQQGVPRSQHTPHARALPEDAPGSSSSSGAVRRSAARSGAELRRGAAVRKVLAQRARAVRTGDREAFLATVDPSDARLRAAQGHLFDNLTRLPLAQWEYTIVPKTGSSPRHPARSSANVWTPHVKLTYRLAGFDEGAVTASRHMTVVYGQRGWRITDVRDSADPRMWDLGEIRVVRKDQAMVVGVDTPRRELRGIAREVDRAMPVVSDVWGRDWARSAVVLVPSTQQQADALSPDEESLDQITAVATVGSGPSGVPPPGSGDRIIVNPANFSHLSSLGRRVVLRHELTHVATRGFTDTDVPMWLTEGFADYVGYVGVDLPPQSVARKLSTSLRSGNLPERLPARGDFAETSGNLTRSYESAWLACKLIQQRYGEQRLVRLYRMMGSDQDASSTDVRRRSMRRVLGMTRQEFTSAWRSYVRATLG